RRICRHDENEWRNLRRTSCAVIAIQFHRYVIVVVDGVLQLDQLKLALTHGTRVEILAGSNGRLLDETICHGLAERIIINDVAKRLRPRSHGFRGGVSSRPRIGFRPSIALAPALAR